MIWDVAHGLNPGFLEGNSAPHPVFHVTAEVVHHFVPERFERKALCFKKFPQYVSLFAIQLPHSFRLTFGFELSARIALSISENRCSSDTFTFASFRPAAVSE